MNRVYGKSLLRGSLSEHHFFLLVTCDRFEDYIICLSGICRYCRGAHINSLEAGDPPSDIETVTSEIPVATEVESMDQTAGPSQEQRGRESPETTEDEFVLPRLRVRFRVEIGSEIRLHVIPQCVFMMCRGRKKTLQYMLILIFIQNTQNYSLLSPNVLNCNILSFDVLDIVIYATSLDLCMSLSSPLSNILQ